MFKKIFFVIFIIFIIYFIIFNYKEYFINKEFFINNKKNKRNKRKNQTIITFIIPSIGRDTLIRTITSLQNLDNPNWEAIIVFDGVKNNIKEIKDTRIKTYEIKKKGKKNYGGLTRNYGIDRVKNSKWIGFVDDDDTVSPDYIDRLMECKNNNADCIIFRMFSNNKILPPLDASYICRNKVGISFCGKTEILKKNKFRNNKTEDFNLLNNLHKRKYNILLSKNITYFVGDNPIKNVYKKIIGSQLYNPIFKFSLR